MTSQSGETAQNDQVDSPGARFALIATILASATVILDGTVVNLALPAIAKDLDAGLAAKQWIVVGFSVIVVGDIGGRFAG